MIHAYIRLAVVRTAGEGWVEDCKERFSPPDLRTSALNESGLMHRDNINAMKQNGFGMARDLQHITGNWGFRALGCPARIPRTLAHLARRRTLVCLLTCSYSYRSTTLTWCNFHEPPGEGHLSLSATMTSDTETRFQLCSARCIS